MEDFDGMPIGLQLVGRRFEDEKAGVNSELLE